MLSSSRMVPLAVAWDIPARVGLLIVTVKVSSPSYTLFALLSAVVVGGDRDGGGRAASRDGPGAGRGCEVIGLGVVAGPARGVVEGHVVC